MAVLLSGTTIGGSAAIHAGNMGDHGIITTSNIGSHALTSLPSNAVTTAGGQTIGGTTYFSGGESLNLYGIRGRFTNEYIHLYNKVGIGHPSGWGEGQTETPSQGLSTYGGMAIAYGTGAASTFYGRIDAAYSSDRYQMSFRGGAGNYWWITNDSDKLGIHLNGTGDRIYFATDGNIWSAYYNDWLSNVLANKQNSSTAITTSNIGSQSVSYANSAGTAGQVSGVSISASEANALKTTLGVTSLPYSVDITVNGDADKFYAVQFWGGDQDVWRRIIIKRGYSEPAPWDPIGTGVHHGGLLLDWEGNFGGWGGAEYADRLRVFNESYTNVCADMFIWSHSMGYVFMLRGGGALYHLHSDQAINGYYQSGSPDILYSTSTLSYDDTWSGTNVYDVPAPAPLSLDQVNSTRIDGLRTKKQSLLDGRYQQLSTAINTSNIGSQSVSYASSSGNSATTSQRSFDYIYGTSYLESAGAVFGTIFYDNNDRGFYGDFAGTSRMNEIVYDNLKWAGDQNYGLIGRNGYLDTLNGRGDDPLELNYYDGGPVKIGSGTYGSKDLYASMVYVNGGNAVIHAGNIGSQSVNYASSAGNADTVDGYHESSFFRDNQDRTLSVLRFTGVGGDSGNSTNHGYAIYQGGGGWSHPYPDLHIGYHTGIKIGANTGYGGIRFYNDSTMETILFSVGDGDANVRVANTLFINGNTAIHAGNIGSQSVSYATTSGSATTAGSAPNAGNLNTSYGVTAGAGNGLKFWNGEDTYKISMGNSDEYHYGPVTDYSIKTVIDSVGATRGFTWGQNGVTPIAALNVGNGNMQIAGAFTASNFSGSSSGTNTGDQTNISGNAATATRTSGQSGYPFAGTGMFAFYNWGGNNGGASAPNDGSYTVGISVGSNPGDQAYGFQIGRNMWNDGLWTRGYDSGWREWVRLIDSTNIGSQSVASATSASYADSIYFNGVQKLYGGSDGTRNTGWAYHTNNGTGLHWPNNGWHIYPINASDMYIRSGASDCSLKFTKSGESGSYVHCSADNDIGFLTTGRSWSLRVDNSGNAFATSSFRAPIFYDSDDTGYYVDPNSNSYLSTLRIADASGGVSLSVGNGSTHGVYTADNARKYLVVAADYYPHMALVASGANNTNHGAVFSFVGSEGGSFRQWNIGIPNNNPFIFSIGYNRTGDANPHYGVGDGWSSEDYNHARLSIDRDGNTKIRGMLYVNGTSGGISTGSAVIHAGNIGSQSVSNATTAGGLAVHTGRNNEANKIVRTQENGYVFFGYINSSSGNENNNSNPDRVWGTNGSDDYLRTYRTSALSVGYAASAGSASTASVAEFQSIPDARGNAYTPNDYTGNRIWWHFNNKDTVGGYGTYWHAIQTVSPWSSYDPSHRQQQIQWGGTDISFRYATSGTTWSSWYRFITDNNIGSQSVSYADESGYSGSTGSVEWTNVNSRPTALSQFTNDSGFITSSGSISGNAATANGANGNFYIDDNYGNTIVGVYTSTRYQGVFAMGDAYKLPADGTSTGSLYGLAWSHPNAGGVAGNLNTHGLLVMENGTFLAAISGSIRSRDDMRAPIFYDSNNTNYYVDPASGSNLYGGNGSFVIQGTWPQLRIAQNDGTPDASINYDAGDGYRKWNVGPGAGEAEGNEFGFAIYEGTRGTLYSTPLRINALTGYVQIGDRDNPAYQLDVSGYGYFRDNIGIATTPRSDAYKISMGGSIHLNGNSVDYVGSLYLEGSGTGGHLQPNAGSYGTLQITGSKSGWAGLRFTDSAVTLMMNTNESGHHNDNYGWQFRWQNGTLYCHKNAYGGGTSATVLDSSNYSSWAIARGGDTVTSIINFQTNNGGRSGATDSAKLQAYSTSNNSAFMSFHKAGHYAVNMGLDDDNVLRIGGWSASANRMQLDMSGNVTFAGDVTAYSDARVKENVKTIENALDKTLKLRGVSYNRIDSDDKSTKIGVIAQEILDVVPEVVNQDNDGMYNVSYGNITALLIEAIKEQQKQIEELKSIINGLTR